MRSSNKSNDSGLPLFAKGGLRGISATDVRSVRDTYPLNRADVGWYQIRHALKARNQNGDTVPVDFTAFESAYAALSEKLRPLVFALGFLR